MEKNPLLRLCFPHLCRPKNATEWNKSRIIIERDKPSKDPSIEAMGIMSGALGSRATLIVLDDIVDLRNAVLNPKLKEQVRQKLFGEIIPLLEPEGIIRGCGTPWTVCMPGYANVHTEKGLVQIQNITKENEIWVTEGKFEKPEGIATHYHIGDLINVYVTGFTKPIPVTPNHRIPTLRGNIFADELTTEDFVCLPGKQIKTTFAPREWRKIKKIEITPYNDIVYDLQTSTGYFATESIVVHNSDCNAIMKESPGWKVVGPHHVGTMTNTDSLDIADKFVDKFTPIWEYKFDRKALIDLHRILGPAEYARAYLCQALTGDTVPIQAQWIKYYTAHVLGDPFRLQCLNIYDLAIEQTAAADYFAFASILFDPERNYVFVADAWHDRLSFRGQSNSVISNAKIWYPQDIIIERGGYQGSLESYLVEDTTISLPIYPFHNRNRNKERRAIEVQPFFERGLVWFHPKFNPARNPEIALTAPIIDEITSFPFGKNDDLLDVIVMGLLTILEMNPDMFKDDNDDEVPFETGNNIQMRMTVI
jgi:phage terminase large subunit-like protein